MLFTQYCSLIQFQPMERFLFLAKSPIYRSFSQIFQRSNGLKVELIWRLILHNFDP